jgi:plasmid stability protein
VISIHDIKMATLLIRDVDAAVHAALRRRAAKHGRPLGAEIREILTRSVSAAERVDWTAVATVRSGRRGRVTRAEVNASYEGDASDEHD